MGRVTSELIAEVACATPRSDEFERQVLGLLGQDIGFDVAFFSDASGASEVSLGLDSNVLELARERFASMAPEGAELLRAARHDGGVVVDSELFGQRLTRLVYYDAYMRPCRGRTTLIGFLESRGRPLGKLVLGRVQGSSDFSWRERHSLRRLLGTLSISRLSYTPLASAPLRTAPLAPIDTLAFDLTPREGEVASYLALGYTNEQIARALGSAPRTVRNQLSEVYRKLGVGSRAEAVARLLGSGAPAESARGRV